MRHHAAVQLRLRLAIHPELTWLLFLRALDEREELETEEAKAVGAPFQPSLEFPYRWRDWAAPGGAKRKELQSGVLGATFAFVNGELLPKLHGLTERSGATPRQRVVGQIMEAVESVRIDTEKNFLDVLDAVHPDQRPSHRPDPRIPVVPGVRGAVAAHGGEEQRRRPVLHAPGSDPGHGEDRRAETRGNGL